MGTDLKYKAYKKKIEEEVEKKIIESSSSSISTINTSSNKQKVN
jgi:hypothetical protein